MNSTYPYTPIFLLLISSFVLLLSCSDDSPTTMVEMEEPIVEEVAKLTADEEDFLNNLLAIDQDMDLTWKGFDCLRRTTIYIVTGEQEGILLNPNTSTLTESQRVEATFPNFETIDLYRNTNLYDYIETTIIAEWQSYGLDWLFGFETYRGTDIFAYNLELNEFTGFYNSYKNRNGYFHEAVFYHELFHFYQDKPSINYFDSNDRQDWDGFIDQNSLPYLILLFDVMIDAYHQGFESDNQRILGYYLSIWNHLIENDKTANNLMRTNGLHLEKLEGMPRFVEVFSTLETFNNNTIDDPTHGFAEYTNVFDNTTGPYHEKISTALNVNQVYARRMFYHTGAGVLYLMRKLGHDNFEEELTQSHIDPYDVAVNFYLMSDQEKLQALEEAKNLYDWEKINEKSEILLSLN